MWFALIETNPLYAVLVLAEFLKNILHHIFKRKKSVYSTILILILLLSCLCASVAASKIELLLVNVVLCYLVHLYLFFKH